MGPRALLVVDLVNDFMDPRGALYCGDQARKIIPVVQTLIADFEARGDFVVYVRDAHAVMDKEFELFAPHAVKGSWGSEIIPELAVPERAFVVDKTRFSSFYGSSLGELLSELAPGEVWLSGVLTSICIMDTAGDLRNRDYTTVIPVDAVADIDPVWHELALTRMHKVYGVRLLGLRKTAGINGKS